MGIQWRIELGICGKIDVFWSINFSTRGTCCSPIGQFSIAHKKKYPFLTVSQKKIVIICCLNELSCDSLLFQRNTKLLIHKRRQSQLWTDMTWIHCKIHWITLQCFEIKGRFSFEVTVADLPLYAHNQTQLYLRVVFGSMAIGKVRHFIVFTFMLNLFSLK